MFNLSEKLFLIAKDFRVSFSEVTDSALWYMANGYQNQQLIKAIRKEFKKYEK